VTSTIDPEIKKTALIQLTKSGAPNPTGDIEKFLEHIGRKKIADFQGSEEFLSMIERRCLREPVERIIGYSSFHDNEYKLYPSVFRPVLETETTLDYALLCAQKFDRPVRILDLGCGNGCMLIALLLKLPDASGVGIDSNPEAINLSKENSRHYKVQDRAQFFVSDWADNLNEKFDIIISNPPRIANSYLDKLVLEVSKYDPVESLDGGVDGLEFYRRTVGIIPKLSNSICYIVMQTGQMISQSVLEVFQNEGYMDSQICRDFKFQPNCIVLSNKVSLKKFSQFISFFKSIFIEDNHSNK
jgi:release factor glutamine methyltransferase